MPNDFSGATSGAEGGGGEGAAASSAAPATTSAPAAPSAPATTGADSSAATPAVDQPGGDAPPAAPPHKALLDDIDNLDGTAPATAKERAVLPTKEPPSTTTQKDGTDAAADLSKAASDEKAAETAAADAGTQSGDGKDEQPLGDETATVDGAEAQTEPETPDSDWNKISKDVADHIKQAIPKADQSLVQKHYKQGAMLRSFMNPACPPNVVVDNMESKSKMRYAAIEGEILKRNLSADPLSLLTKAFEATADESGNSEPYQRLLDATIDTNRDYVLHVLKTKHNLDLAANVNGNGDATPANTGTAVNDLKDEDIDGLASGAGIQQLRETYPEEAAKLDAILNSTKELKSKAAQEAEAKKAAEADQTTEAQTQEAQAELARKTGDFVKVYSENITTPINTKLDKEYGLEVTPEEKEKSPMMAMLKGAKKQLIMSGGLDGSGNFDKDLYEWGQSRPAFKAAAKAIVDFTAAGETENAATAAKEMSRMADMFLAERLKGTPELKLIDELMQMVAKDQKQALDVREDTGGTTYNGNSRTGGPPKNFLEEIDAL
jgi:hypothetical protein